MCNATEDLLPGETMMRDCAWQQAGSSRLDTEFYFPAEGHVNYISHIAVIGLVLGNEGEIIFMSYSNYFSHFAHSVTIVFCVSGSANQKSHANDLIPQNDDYGFLGSKECKATKAAREEKRQKSKVTFIIPFIG